MAELTELDKKYASHLQRFVRCQTISNTDINKIDWAEFDKLHTAFREFYPHVYAEMELDKVGPAGLQFCLKAKNPTKKPLLLMAHQDVVEIGDRSKWVFDPFGGELIDGCICGRGSTDCKHQCLNELEATEALLAEGWRPDYDLYISLGYTEEVMVSNAIGGAENLVQNLEKKGVQLGAVIDEGGGIFPAEGGQLAARIGLGEKAPVNYEIYMDTQGGHSSTPGAGTALGAVAKAIVNIETHPFPYRLTPLVIAQLKATAPIAPADRKEIYADPEGRFEELCALAKTDKALDAMLHSTIAFTMAAASAQSNVLPSHATATVNVRVLQGDTVESVMAYFTSLLPEGVQIRLISGKDPQPTSMPDSHIFAVTDKVLHEMYGDKVHLIPFLMLGGTDSRFYKKITDSIILFTGHLKDSRWGAAHQVNEKIPADALKTGVDYFKGLLKNY